MGKIVFDNVALPKGVVCLNAPDVRIEGGRFERNPMSDHDVEAYNHGIDSTDRFPCVFKGPLYNSIQKRRMRTK